MVEKGYITLLNEKGETIEMTKNYQIPPDAFDYIIYAEGNVVKAKNGKSGRVEFKGNRYIDAKNYVLNALGGSGTVAILTRGGIFFEVYKDGELIYGTFNNRVTIATPVEDSPWKDKINVVWRIAFTTVTPGNYYCAFGDILFDGTKLHIVYRKGSSHAGDKGVIVHRYSEDLGITWSDEEVIAEDDYYDLRDPAISIDSTGRIWVSLFSEDPSTITHYKIGYVYSDDEGKTWSDVHWIDTGYEISAESGRIVEWGDGRLMYPFYARNSTSEKWSSFLAVSDDRGETWEIYKVVDGESVGYDATEPNIFDAGDEVYRVLFRDDTNKKIRLTTSTDLSSWSTPEGKIDAYSTPRVTVTSSGLLLTVVRDSSTNVSVLAVSTDKGETWGTIKGDEHLTLKTCEYGGIAEVGKELYAILVFNEESSSWARGLLTWGARWGAITPHFDVFARGVAVNGGDIIVRSGFIANVNTYHYPVAELQLSGGGGIVRVRDYYGNIRHELVGKDGGRAYLGAPNSAPNTANLQNSQITFHVDEATGELVITAKLSDGTVKTARITLA